MLLTARAYFILKVKFHFYLKRMDGKKIKQILLEANSLIKAKDFVGALSKCKLILDEDASNYNALVFTGAASHEMGDVDTAISSFRAAIAASPEKLSAWQGLRLAYEKENAENHVQNLIEVYQKLLQLYENDKEKITDLNISLGRLYFFKLNDLAEAVVWLEKALAITGRDVSLSNLPIWSLLLSWLSNQSSLSGLHFNLLNEAVRRLLEGKQNKLELLSDWDFDRFEEYFKFLYKQRSAAELHDESKKFQLVFSDNLLILKWQLHAYILSCIYDHVLPIDLEEYSCITENRLDVFPYVLMAKGAWHFTKNEWNEAQDALIAGVQKCPEGCWESYLLICWVLEKTREWKSLQRYARKGLKVAELLLTETGRLNIAWRFQLSLAKGMLYQGSRGSLEASIELLTKILPVCDVTLKSELLYLQAYVYLKLKLPEAADKNITLLKDYDAAALVAGIEGLSCLQSKNWDAARERLETALALQPSDDDDWLIGLGTISWEHEDYKDAYNYYLKAAKVNPYNYKAFLHLGNYYRDIIKDLRKAQRCYKCAYDLHDGDEEVGICLSDCYQSLGDQESNRSLLMSVISETSATRGKWARQRLGLLYLQQNDPDNAIKALQAVLRVHPNDWECWECLAEAYLMRGSLTAALKAFNKVLDLEPKLLYCTYQVASIKASIGLFKEALDGFREVVQIMPSYVPGLKGMGEAYFALARTYLKQSLNEKALACCEAALIPLARAVLQKPEFSCLWKVLGDVCTLVAHIPKEIVKMNVPSALCKGHPLDSSDMIVMEKLEVLGIGCRCYLLAYQCAAGNPSFLYDVGVNCFHQALTNLDREERDKILGKAIVAFKKAVSLSPTTAKFWMALGVAVSISKNKDYQLSQHCFIRAVKSEPNNAVAWSNLGALYLINGNTKLANQAFSMSQSADPSYINCWIGQALIAETVVDSDAMDLFRHCTSLGNHVEGAMGYALWVCRTLTDPSLRESSTYKYSIKQMAAVPAASDCLTLYIGTVRDDPCAYNMLGLLLERQGLLAESKKMFQKALGFISETESSRFTDILHCNHARIMRKLGMIKDSIREALCVKESEFYNHCGLAAAYCQLGDLAESSSAYESALQWLANNNEEKSHLMVKIASIAYQIQGPEAAKTYLFESFAMKPVCVQGLLALGALGILHSDLTLTSAALKELRLWIMDERFVVDIIHLEACHAISQKNAAAAKVFYSKGIHLWPGSSAFWSFLAAYLLHYQSGLVTAVKTAQSAVQLCSVPTVQLFRLLSHCYEATGRKKDRGRIIKKLVFCYPGVKQNWLMLRSL